MHFQILGSSSSGNCALIRTAEATVLIDAGFSGKRIGEMLGEAGFCLSDIDAVFFTHEHSDHIAGLKGLSKQQRIKFFATRGTCEAVRHTLKRPVEWRIFEAGTTFQFADLKVTAFPIPHDAYDPVGFVFRNGEGDLFSPISSVAWLTDLGYVPGNVREHVRTADVLVLEANHDVGLLDNDPKRPWSLKQRIKGRHGHLSNDAALDFLRGVQNPAWQQVYLAHLSRDCNDVDIVRKQFGDCLSPGRCPISIVEA